MVYTLTKRTPALKLDRRYFSVGSLAALCSLGLCGLAQGARRTPYGGRLEAALPLNTKRIDPHDPEDLTARLIGSSLFDTLYAQTESGVVYPTLAASLPEQDGTACVVTLRPSMRFWDGSVISAASVKKSIERSQTQNTYARASLGVGLDKTDKLKLRFSGINPQDLAKTLCELKYSLVSERFQPERPIGSGALRIDQLGSALRLSRNVLAPRGGSFLDGAMLKSAEVISALRDFEAKRSDLCLLGLGLHQDRRDASRYELRDVASVVLLAGTKMKISSSMGELHSYLDHLASGPLQALGIFKPRLGPAQWAGRPIRILVKQDEPWLVAIAEQIAQGWSRPGAEVTTLRATESVYQSARRSGDFDVALTAVSGALSPTEVLRYLYRLDGKVPPRGALASVEQAGRQLHLGVVGTLKPQGGAAKSLRQIARDDRFSLDLAVQSSSG